MDERVTTATTGGRFPAPTAPRTNEPRLPALAVLHRDGLGWARSPRLAALHAAVHSPSGRQPSTTMR